MTACAAVNIDLRLVRHFAEVAARRLQDFGGLNPQTLYAHIQEARDILCGATRARSEDELPDSAVLAADASQEETEEAPEELPEEETAEELPGNDEPDWPLPGAEELGGNDEPDWELPQEDESSQ